jgi:cytochrome c-type biogenesis protein CcmF
MLHQLRDDLYIVVGSVDKRTQVASFQFHINPLVTFIWIGCLILIGGSIICMWPQFEPQESRAWTFARGTAAVGASIWLGVLVAVLPTHAYAQSTSQVPHTGTVHLESEHERAFFSKFRCMCGCNGNDLLSTCPCDIFAEPWRQKIRAKLADGESEAQILSEYEAEFGKAALSLPPDHGAFRAIYAVPLAAIAASAAGVFVAVRRWRRNTSQAPAKVAAGGAPAAKDAFDAQLDQELKELDE